jgi:hypothetical protein
MSAKAENSETVRGGRRKKRRFVVPRPVFFSSIFRVEQSFQKTKAIVNLIAQLPHITPSSSSSLYYATLCPKKKLSKLL